MYISLMANDEHFFHVFIGHSYINGEMFFAYFLIELFSILLFKLRTFEIQKYYYSLSCFLEINSSPLKS